MSMLSRRPDRAKVSIRINSHETTYDAAIASYGYLYATASAKELKFEFWPLTDSSHSEPFNSFSVDLGTHILTRG